jgi:copper transport protein
VRAPSSLAGALVAAAALLAPAGALAHAEPVAGEPQPGGTIATAPQSVRLVLSAPVEAEFLRMEVTTPGGTSVAGPAGRDTLDPRAIVAPVNVPPGTPGLVVRWRVLSRDGHAGGGVYGVGIGGPAPEVSGLAAPARPDHGPVAVLARLLALVAPLGLLGLVVLAAGVVGPAVAGGGLGPPGESPAVRGAFRARAAEAVGDAARGWWTAWVGLLLAGVAGLVLTPLVTLSALREGPGGLGELLGGTTFGFGWRLQAAGLAVALIATVVTRRATGTGRLPDEPVPALGLAFGPLAALYAISATGHAGTGDDRTLNVGIDLVHNLATAAWIGGLVGLAVLVAPAVAALGDDDRTRLGAAVVVRFSTLALTAVALLVVTGVYRALAEVSLGELTGTAYGRALLVKLGLFGVMLVGGAYNRFVIHPRLERAALGLDPDDRGAGASLRLSVRAELAVAALLLVAVAVLVSLAPPG